MTLTQRERMRTSCINAIIKIKTRKSKNIILDQFQMQHIKDHRSEHVGGMTTYKLGTRSKDKYHWCYGHFKIYDLDKAKSTQVNQNASF